MPNINNPRRKLRKSMIAMAESANAAEQSQQRQRRKQTGDSQDYNDMDLIFSDIKGRMPMETLREVLHHSKICSYTLQFFIKQHFVRGFKAAPTFYVESEKQNE